MTEQWRCNLLKAADILEQEGWRRGALGHCGGPKCMFGAIVAASGSDPGRTTNTEAISNHYQEAEQIAAYIKKYEASYYMWGDDDMFTGMRFNDSRSPFSGRDEVVKVLRGAAVMGLPADEG